MSTEDACDLIQHHFGPDFDVKKLISRTYACFEEYIQAGGEVDFRPGAKEAVEYFYRNGFKIALASSNIRQWVDYLLERKGIKKYFSSITTSDDVSKPKPDPEVYLKTAEKLKMDVKECLVFEDSVAGATAAISAGMRTCVVPQIKQPNSFVRQNAFKIYESLENIYPDMEDLVS
jgi:HAD superfamily hydrolase (TIGR01549 family)